MANVYYLHFPLMVSFTKVIVTESEDEARAIAMRLVDDEDFCQELLELDSFRKATVLMENLLNPKVSFLGSEEEVADWIKRYEADRLLTDEDIAKYGAEGARHTFAADDQSHGGRQQ